RPAQLGLDAGDGGRPAPAGRGRSRRAGRAWHADLALSIGFFAGGAGAAALCLVGEDPVAEPGERKADEGGGREEDGSPGGGFRDARGGALGGRGVHPRTEVRRVIGALRLPERDSPRREVALEVLGDRPDRSTAEEDGRAEPDDLPIPVRRPDRLPGTP